MIRVYTQPHIAHPWIRTFTSKPTLFACVLGFTQTGLIPNISAAGATPEARRYTAIADAEFLYCGPSSAPRHPLPPLTAGASPTLISRAVVDAHRIPLYLFNAGLVDAPSVPAIDLGGIAAECVSSGAAMSLATVKHLFEQGLTWGEKLASHVPEGYLVLGECVVGGTTTALAVLTGLGWNAAGKINSSHVTCNHAQKQALVEQGLRAIPMALAQTNPLKIVAAVGDPMQPVVAGMAIAASRTCGVLLAGGTQMLAVYGLMQAIGRSNPALSWNRDRVMVGTTRWVADDPTGDTVGLANLLDAPLLATQLNFALSRHAQLRAYEQGFVKEGVGAGGCAIAAHLNGWGQDELLGAIDQLADELLETQLN